MANFRGNFKVIADALYEAGLDVGTGRHKLNQEYDNALTNGTGANKANMMFTDSRNLSSSTGEDLDLSGTLEDAFGNSVAFTNLKAIIIKASADNGANLAVGGASTNALDTLFSDTSDEILVAPGGTFCVIAPDATGYAVTASTADLLRVENLDGAAAADYDIILIGESS